MSRPGAEQRHDLHDHGAGHRPAGNQSTASGSFIITDTGTAPTAPAITSVTDDVLPVTGTLTSGGSTNDTDLAVRVSLSGTNAVAGDTIQLYNGTGTGSQLGTT